MKSSEEIKDLARALSKAQGQMDAAVKGSTNPYFKSKYADLASVVNALRGPFGNHGLSFVQLPVPTEGDKVVVETVLLHESGQWISCAVDVPVSKGDAQGYGSAITYAKRYGLQAMAGLSAEDEDDDGNAAAKAKPRATEEEMTPKPKVRHEVAASPERTVKFTISKANYATAGMTETQMRQSIDLVPVVDKRYGQDYSKTLLREEFGVTTRLDLTEESAAKYLVRLMELKEAE